MSSVKASPTQTCRQCGRDLAGAELEGVCAACLWGWFSAADEPAGRAVAGGAGRALFHVPGHEVFEEIARGGMGIVYRARQQEPAREVALKMLLPHQLGSSEVLRRFELEARSLAGCEHPAILPVYQSGAHDGMPFFTMKLAVGGTLAQRKERLAGRWQAIADLLATVADAVQFAHERGVLHRDLKPGNILFDEQDRPYVSDFGLAKLLGAESALTQTTDTLGTPHYMAPEVAAGSARQATIASDIYSLGAVLYELLAGRPPFEAESVPALLKKIVEEEPARPRLDPHRPQRGPAGAATTSPPAARISPPKDLEVITLKCLAKEPARRYPSARELAGDLRRFLGGEPILARPMSAPARFTRWCRLNPVIASVSGALVLVVLAGFAGVLTQWRRAERHAAAEGTERRRAEAEARAARLNLYAADIQAAHQALRRGDYGFVRRTLAAHRPAGGQEDLRGFEWRLLWTLSRGEQLRLLPGHTDAVTSVAFSPDDTTLASASLDGTVRFWDARSGEPGPVLQADAQGVLSVAFSPDGAFLATGGETGAKLWRVADRQVTHTFPGRRTRVAFSPTPPMLAVASDGPQDAQAEGHVSVWNYRTGARLLELPEAGGRVAFSPGGNLLATAGDRGAKEDQIAVWNTATGDQVQVFRKDRALSMIFSPDGRKLLASRQHGSIVRCDLETKHIDEPWPGDAGNACALALSPDGRNLAAACYDHTIRLGRPDTGLERAPGLRGHTREPQALAYSGSGRWLASGGLDMTVRIWEVTTNLAATRLQNIGAAPRFAPGSSRIGYRAGKEIVMVWDLSRWQEVAVLPVRQPLGFSADGRTFLGASVAPVAVQFWDVADRRLLRTVPLEREERPHSGMNASPDGALVYVREDNGSVGVWDTATGRRRCDIRGSWKESFAARFSQDGGLIALTVDDGVLVCWDTAANRLVRQFKAHAGQAGRLAHSADGRHLATTGDDGLIKVWDTRTWNETARFSGHRSAVWDVAFAPDGRTLASTSYGQALLWHLPTARKLLTLVEEGGDQSVTFDPDGRTLVVEMRGNTAEVWRAAPMSECEAELDLFHQAPSPSARGL